jgi:hypothetical protein
MKFPSSRVAPPRTFLLLAVIAVVLMLAAVADAVTVVETHAPIMFHFLNTCIVPAEPFIAAGFFHVKASFNQSGGGTVLQTFEANLQNMKGMTTSGVTYIVPEESTTHIVGDGSDLMPMNFTFEQMSQFIRQGENGTLFLNDDFFTHLLIHGTINAKGVMTVDRVEPREGCR